MQGQCATVPPLASAVLVPYSAAWGQGDDRVKRSCLPSVVQLFFSFSLLSCRHSLSGFWRRPGLFVSCCVMISGRTGTLGLEFFPFLTWPDGSGGTSGAAGQAWTVHVPISFLTLGEELSAFHRRMLAVCVSRVAFTVLRCVASKYSLLLIFSMK